MSDNTFIKKRRAMKQNDIEKCHGGAGTAKSFGVLDENETKSKKMNFLHDTSLPPGASIGVHEHGDDEEYYYIVSGRGSMTLDGKKQEVGPGDITAVFPGGTHGLENTGNEDLRIIVISVK